MNIEITPSDPSKRQGIYRGDIIKDNLADRCLTVDDFVCTNGEKCLKGSPNPLHLDWATCYGGVPKIPDGFRLHVYNKYNCETENKIDKTETPRCAYYLESLYDYKAGVRDAASWSLVQTNVVVPEMTLWLYAANKQPGTPVFTNIRQKGRDVQENFCQRIDPYVQSYWQARPAECLPFHEYEIDYDQICGPNEELVTRAGNERNVSCKGSYQQGYRCHVDTKVYCGEFNGSNVLKNHNLEPLPNRISIDILQRENLTEWGDYYKGKERFPMNLKLEFKASRIPTFIEEGLAYTLKAEYENIKAWLINFTLHTSLPSSAKLYWYASLCVQIVSNDFFNRVYNFKHVPRNELSRDDKNIKMFSHLCSKTDEAHKSYFDSMKNFFRETIDTKSKTKTETAEQQKRNIDCCISNLSVVYTLPEFKGLFQVSVVVPLNVYQEWRQRRNVKDHEILQIYLRRFFDDEADPKRQIQIEYTSTEQLTMSHCFKLDATVEQGTLVVGVRLTGQVYKHSVMSILYISIRFNDLMSDIDKAECDKVSNDLEGLVTQDCLEFAMNKNINKVITSCQRDLRNIAKQVNVADISRAFVTVGDKYCQCINKFSETEATNLEESKFKLCFGKFCTNHSKIQEAVGRRLDKDWSEDKCSDMCEPFANAYANSDITSEVNVDQFRRLCPHIYLPMDKGTFVNRQILLVGAIVELVYLSLVGLSRRLGERHLLRRDLLIGMMIAIVYGGLSIVLHGESKICQYNAANKNICQKPADSTKQYEAVCVNRLAGHEYRIPHEFCSRRIHDECITQNDCLAPEFGCSTCDMDTHQCMADAAQKRVTEVVEYRKIPYYTLLMVIPCATLLIRAALTHVRDRKVIAGLVGTIVLACVASVIMEYRAPNSYRQTKKCELK